MKRIHGALFSILATSILLGCAPGRPSVSRREARAIPAHAAAAPAHAPQRVSFETQVRPVLESRCQPCHFAGGSMYESLPFDRPATIRTLGEKLFTRIRDEREQALLRAFLAQGADPEPLTPLAPLSPRERGE